MIHRVFILGAPDVPNSDTALRRHSSITSVNQSSKSTSKYVSQPISSPSDLTKQSVNQAIKISLKITLLDSLTVQYESILLNQELFVFIPNITSAENSKEAFIALLEFAEEELLCKKLVVYFDKNKPNRSMFFLLL